MRRVTDRPTESIWMETDDIAAVAKDFEAKGGISLQDCDDHQFWLIQGHLVHVVGTSPQTRPAPSVPKSGRLRTLLTVLGLVAIVAVAVFVVVAMFLLMSMPK